MHPAPIAFHHTCDAKLHEGGQDHEEEQGHEGGHLQAGHEDQQELRPGHQEDQGHEEGGHHELQGHEEEQCHEDHGHERHQAHEDQGHGRHQVHEEASPCHDGQEAWLQANARFGTQVASPPPGTEMCHKGLSQLGMAQENGPVEPLLPVWPPMVQELSPDGMPSAQLIAAMSLASSKCVCEKRLGQPFGLGLWSQCIKALMYLSSKIMY